jgi:hypothetical protein
MSEEPKMRWGSSMRSSLVDILEKQLNSRTRSSINFSKEELFLRIQALLACESDVKAVQDTFLAKYPGRYELVATPSKLIAVAKQELLPLEKENIEKKRKHKVRRIEGEQIEIDEIDDDENRAAYHMHSCHIMNNRCL